ncbi:hypothetical protein G7084_00405 [Weissella coleopterorum]|uniref:Uncharacterized protein n=1 Tax=Weissella coleopterorum TaxID=2714949 RepID=A0A6G8AY80_9LACO|nr:hypothetical protein [Weissella coleopterorum]QIL49919.1 hypothetical protein G7084_00405 [Weissella coleopterorum]
MDKKAEFLIKHNLIDENNYTEQDISKFEFFKADELDSLGRELIENVGGISELPLNMQETPFNYEFFARDHIEDGSILLIDGVYVRNNEKYI